MPSISFEVSTTSPMVKRIFEADSSIAISWSLPSIRRCISPTVLFGMMTPGMPLAPDGQRNFDLREPVTVGRDRAQHLALSAGRVVQIDAVQIIAGLFGRGREMGLVDHPLQVGARQLEAVRHVAGIEIGEVAFRQRLQREARAAGADREHAAVAGGFEHDLRAFRQFAHDVVDHVRRHGGRAARRDLGRDGLVHLEIEVGRLQRQLAAFGAQQHIGEDRDGIAPLDHAMHMTERFQQLRALDGDLHLRKPWEAPEMAPL